MRNLGLLGIAGSTVSALVLTAIVGVGPAETAAPGAATSAPASVITTKPAAPKKFSPAGGITFNNPYGSKRERRAIISKLLRTIDSVPKGGEIRIASWNVRSNNITAALVRAHRRNVSVQVVMDYSNANPDNPNIDVRHLKEGLRPGNKSRKPSRRSWVVECKSACRGPHGIAHTKFYLFSQAGKAHDIVVFGSNNATELAASIQWNDIFTVVNQSKMYSDFEGVFHEMAKDRKPKRGGYREFTYPKLTTVFYPNAGMDAPKLDPDLVRLNKIRCTGTTGGVGFNGRTKIRIAQTAMHGDRGIRLAQRLATMQRRGCDIRIVYAMFGAEVLKILRGAGIGLTHLAWDSNEDGIYDRYLHMKTMAVAGVYAGKTNAFLTVNGSANWTSVAQISDEIVGIIDRAEPTRKYINWIDYLYHHRPASWGVDDGTGTGTGEERIVARRARANGVDPYALIKKDL